MDRPGRGPLFAAAGEVSARSLLPIAIGALIFADTSALGVNLNSIPKRVSSHGALVGGHLSGACTLGLSCPCEKFEHAVRRSSSEPVFHDSSSSGGPKLSSGGPVGTSVKRAKSQVEVELQELGAVDITDVMTEARAKLRGNNLPEDERTPSP
jgi:hypothetical protein